MNPVVLLDEVDKLGSDWRGDPSSALLEVLDPAQNHTFRDHYLDVDLDLSNVLFLATANMAEQIPGPLLDRMEVVRLDGYTEDEKVAIARDHLLARQLRANGLTAERGRHHRRRPADHRDRLHPGGRRAVARAPAGQAAAQGGHQAGVHPGAGDHDVISAGPSSSSLTTCGPGWVGPASSPRWPSAPRCPAWRPAWPSPGRAATCCSSRRRACRRVRADHHRPAGRRHEGVGRDRPLLRPLPRRRPERGPPTPSKSAASTSTSPPAPSPRTAPRPGSP